MNRLGLVLIQRMSIRAYLPTQSSLILNRGITDNMNSTLKKTVSIKRIPGTRTTSTPKVASPRGSAAVAKIKEQIALQKYDYYKSNRASLPSDIREHSEEITRLMEGGMSAEDAFNEVSKLCFDY